jgi:AraC-like DNA-binding protein
MPVPAHSPQRYVERRPVAELDDLVACAWLLQVSSEGPAYEHRTVPNGCVEIASALGSGLVRVVGPRRQPTLGRVQPGETIVGVRFRPGAAPVALGWPVDELVDLTLDLDQLWGSAARGVEARLAEAATPEEAIGVVERHLMTRAAHGPDPLVVEAVERLQPWRHLSVGRVISELYISPRQLRRRFVAALGVGPKTLQRTLRFQGLLALNELCKDGELPLARLAATAGYADQPHLTRECRELTGLTPRAFFAEMRRSCGPSHDHAASFVWVRRALLAAREMTPAATPERRGGSRDYVTA